MTELETQNNKERYFTFCREYIQREGIEPLLAYLERKTDFFTAPCSTKFHLNTAGGLCLHSMNVFETALAINQHVLLPAQEAGKSIFKEPISLESIAICSLLHDICKCNTYHPKEKWRKDANGRWESYLGYEIEDDFPFGHGEKSCYIINYYMKLKKEELLAIRWHMGMFEVTEPNSSGRFAFYKACETSPLVVLLQMADMSSTNWLEETIKDR